MEGEEGGRRSEQWPGARETCRCRCHARKRRARCAERRRMAQATQCGLMVSHRQGSALRMDKEEESRSSRGARAAGDSRHGKVVQDDRFVGGPCLANPESLQGSTKLFLQVSGAS